MDKYPDIEKLTEKELTAIASALASADPTAFTCEDACDIPEFKKAGRHWEDKILLALCRELKIKFTEGANPQGPALNTNGLLRCILPGGTSAARVFFCDDVSFDLGDSPTDSEV